MKKYDLTVKPFHQLSFFSLLAVLVLTWTTPAQAAGLPEKEDLKFGFIKLTDMVPLAIAYEKG